MLPGAGDKTVHLFCVRVTGTSLPSSPRSPTSRSQTSHTEPQRNGCAACRQMQRSPGTFPRLRHRGVALWRLLRCSWYGSGQVRLEPRGEAALGTEPTGMVIKGLHERGGTGESRDPSEGREAGESWMDEMGQNTWEQSRVSRMNEHPTTLWLGSPLPNLKGKPEGAEPVGAAVGAAVVGTPNLWVIRGSAVCL